MSHLPKKILTATDFSETADQAGALARDLARRFEAHLQRAFVVAHALHDHARLLHPRRQGHPWRVEFLGLAHRYRVLMQETKRTSLASHGDLPLATPRLPLPGVAARR